MTDERTLASTLFNQTWTLIDRPDRTPAEDARMVHTAHASRLHWETVGTAVNHVRGEWLCSRVYAVLGRAEPALWHARRTLALCEENAVDDFDLACAYEALARANAITGDFSEAAAWTERARAVTISDQESAALLTADLATVPTA